MKIEVTPKGKSPEWGPGVSSDVKKTAIADVELELLQVLRNRGIPISTAKRLLEGAARRVENEEFK